MKYTRHRNACDVDRKFTDHLFMCAPKIRREAGKEVMSAGNGFDDEAFMFTHRICTFTHICIDDE